MHCCVNNLSQLTLTTPARLWTSQQGCMQAMYPTEGKPWHYATCALSSLRRKVRRVSSASRTFLSEHCWHYSLSCPWSEQYRRLLEPLIRCKTARFLAINVCWLEALAYPQYQLPPLSRYCLCFPRFIDSHVPA